MVYKMQKYPAYKKVYVTLPKDQPYSVPLGLGRIPRPVRCNRRPT